MVIFKELHFWKIATPFSFYTYVKQLKLHLVYHISFFKRKRKCVLQCYCWGHYFSWNVHHSFSCRISQSDKIIIPYFFLLRWPLRLGVYINFLSVCQWRFSLIVIKPTNPEYKLTMNAPNLDCWLKGGAPGGAQFHFVNPGGGGGLGVQVGFQQIESCSKHKRLMCDFQLHGNPGDYAWGRGGLDAIITQVRFWRTSFWNASNFCEYLEAKETPLLQLWLPIAAVEPHGWNRSSSYGQRKHCRHSHGDWYCLEHSYLFQLTRSRLLQYNICICRWKYQVQCARRIHPVLSAGR